MNLEEIKFKKKNVVLVGLLMLILLFVAVIWVSIVELGLYTPEIKNEPYVEPNAKTK